MKYGYDIGSKVFIPWYDNGEGKQYFRKKQIKGALLNVTGVLANLSAPQRWSQGKWYLDEKGVLDGEERVFFTAAIYTTAFLGAAKTWFEARKSVEIDL